MLYGSLCFKGAMIESYLILVLLIFENNKLTKVKKEVVVETWQLVTIIEQILLLYYIFK